MDAVDGQPLNQTDDDYKSMNIETFKDKDEAELKKCPIPFFDKFLRKTNDASAFGFFRMGNGPVLMSNVYLSAALITLAEKEIDCYYADDDVEHDECGDVYGFKPSSLITNIGTMTGILSALLVPFIGAVIDCTDHRRKIGVLAALTMIVFQATQIFTFQSTWVFMAILQGVNGFIYNVQTLAAYSYLPGIATAVGPTTMIKYTAEYAVVMFSMEAFYLVLCLGIGIALGLGDNNEATARLGQGVNVIVSGLLYYFAWKFFTSAPARRCLNEGESIVTAGFIQVFRTAKGIKNHYSSTLGYFLLAVMFCDAGHGAFTLIAVTYLAEVCNIKGQQLGFIFLLILLSTIPGSYFGAWVSKKTSPKTSIQIQLISIISFNFVAFLTMTNPEPEFLPYLYGSIWGMLLGWFYPAETAIFSMVQPKGQESELTGIFMYSAQILSWLPTLVFTIMNESDIHMKWGGMFINVYFLIALWLFQLMAPWEICLAVSKEPNRMLLPDN